MLVDSRTNTPVDGHAWTRHGSYTPIPVSPNYHKDRGRSSRDGGRFLIPRLRCSTGVSINSRVYARLLSFYDPPSFQPVDRPNLSDRPPSRLDCPHSWLSQSGSSLETRRWRIPREEASRCYAAELFSNDYANPVDLRPLISVVFPSGCLRATRSRTGFFGCRRIKVRAMIEWTSRKRSLMSW